MYVIDNESIHLAVKKYSDIILRIAFLHTKSNADAEDITQDTFLALIKRPHIEDEEHLKAWLIRVAINKCKDLSKSSAKRRNVSLDAAITKFKLNEDDLGVIECINGLPMLERSIVMLHYVEDFSIKEISTIIGKKEGAITMRLKRARVKLKDLLEE